MAQLAVSHAEHRPTPNPTAPPTPEPAPPLFTQILEHPVVEELAKLNLDNLTPLQAFDQLRRLHDQARQD